jgi:ABC-2 type transport system ATP-binding protein
VALVNDPKVLFLDEPTTGLDPQARRNLWDLVTDIKKRGTTIVLTTHYMDEAEVLCDRIAIMDHAKIVALDTTENLLARSGVSPRIEFKAEKPLPQGFLENLSNVEGVVKENTTYFVSTKNPQSTLVELFSSGQNATMVEELTVKKATLEDVFLKLTGHELRD